MKFSILSLSQEFSTTSSLFCSVQGLSTFSIKLPLVVLACVGERATNIMPIRDVIAGLRLEEFNL